MSDHRNYQIRDDDGYLKFYTSLYGVDGAMNNLPSPDGFSTLIWHEIQNDGQLQQMRFVMKTHEGQWKPSSEMKLKSLSQSYANCHDPNQIFLVHQTNEHDYQLAKSQTIQEFVNRITTSMNHLSLDVIDAYVCIQDLAKTWPDLNINFYDLSHRKQIQNGTLTTFSFGTQIVYPPLTQIEDKLVLVYDTVVRLQWIQNIYSLDEFKTQFGHL